VTAVELRTSNHALSEFIWSLTPDVFIPVFELAAIEASPAFEYLNNGTNFVPLAWIARLLNDEMPDDF